MFKKEDDYFNAIKHAQIYASLETKSSNNKSLVVKFFFLACVGYATFTYLQNSSNSFSLPTTKQAVLGVSETVDDSELAIVVSNSMKVLISEPSIQSKSSYTEDIARVLDDKSGFKGRIAVVSQGDECSID